ncbi:MAG: MBL fold metallo-hydrolase [Promethearchaeota archaeon]|jgi:glyoxylase-like metal-dependent hydrolase (beta-lactamase superfamily II)
MFDCLIYDMKEQMALFVIENNGKTVLIDTGTSSEVDSLLNYLQKIGIDHLDYIFSTHVHEDHTGGVKRLSTQFPKARIVVSKFYQKLPETKFAKKGSDLAEYHKYLLQNLKNRVIYVGEGDIISLDDLKLEIYTAPGHTPEHIAILDRKNMNLFPGDSIGGHHLGSGFSRPTTYPPYFNHESYSKTVRKLSQIDNLKSISLAHFGVATGPEVQEVFKIAEDVFRAYKDIVIESYQKNNGDLNSIIAALLDKFGRSPNEIKHNRPDALIFRTLGGISIGFINALGLKSKL